MDIAAASVVMNQSKLAQQVGLAVFKKAMDSAKTNSDTMIKVMEQSVTPHVGQNVDIRI